MVKNDLCMLDSFCKDDSVFFFQQKSRKLLNCRESLSGETLFLTAYKTLSVAMCRSIIL